MNMTSSSALLACSDVLMSPLLLKPNLEVIRDRDIRRGGAMERNSIASPAGDYVAQERSLPEGSELPYGHGVFVRRAGVPLWATSKLASRATASQRYA